MFSFGSYCVNFKSCDVETNLSIYPHFFSINERKTYENPRCVKQVLINVDIYSHFIIAIFELILNCLESLHSWPSNCSYELTMPHLQ